MRKHLVDRRESETDRRLVHLTVTPAGVETLASITQARVKRLQQAMATFTEGEQVQLSSLLERLLLAMLRDEQTVQDCCLRCGTDHFDSCVINEAYLALSGRSIEHP